MTVPSAGTPEYRLWLAALMIARSAPVKKGGYSASALIPWQYVEELRDAFDGVGIEWRDDDRDEPANIDAKGRCPSASAQGRVDRCGLFSHPPRCTAISCSMIRS